ncbi:MAG: triose-phosphate isomerase [Candidatus Woesearchaeota archaeon]
MRTPIILINFKNYEKAVGKNAVKLAKICEKVAKETRTNIVAVVNPIDLRAVASSVKIPVFAQHIDPIEYGKHTGHILPELVKQAGAKGTLINHSEFRLQPDQIKKAVKRAKLLKLTTVVCASTPKIAAAVAKFHPDFIAIEPPELIGSEKSVSSAKPEIILKTIAMVRKVAKIPVICGAGVKDKNDVIVALKLGSVGVLAASHIAQASNPEKPLRELALGTKHGT